MNVDINKIGSKVAGVNELVRLKLLKPFTDELKVYVNPVCVRINDKKYFRNWCFNVLSVWCLCHAEKYLLLSLEGQVLEIEIYDWNTFHLIATFSKKNGLVYS